MGDAADSAAQREARTTAERISNSTLVDLVGRNSEVDFLERSVQANRRR
jgi:hypothetical protein